MPGNVLPGVFFVFQVFETAILQKPLAKNIDKRAIKNVNNYYEEKSYTDVLCYVYYGLCFFGRYSIKT
jgi:hypothetical protein